MVPIIEYKKITIDHAIYIKVFTDGTVPYITVSTDNVLNTTNNEKEFPKLTRVLEENFEIKIKEGSALKYLNIQIFQSHLGFSIVQTDHIMELVNEWFPTGSLEQLIRLLVKTLHIKSN